MIIKAQEVEAAVSYCMTAVQSGKQSKTLSQKAGEKDRARPSGGLLKENGKNIWGKYTRKHEPKHKELTQLYTQPLP